jgi:hypothetical protein
MNSTRCRPRPTSWAEGLRLRRRAAVGDERLVDALSEFGIRHIDMPATPERLWRAIHEARKH